MPAPIMRKIAVMGYKSVGKSSIVIQFVNKQFVEAYDPTIENTFSANIKVKNQSFELEIIDTAGQDEYSLFPDSYALDIHGYVLVYSITSSKSFEIVKVIYEKMSDMLIKVPIILIGNKTDLHMDREVTNEQGKRLAASWGAGFMEVCAKQHSEVALAFKGLLTSIEEKDGHIGGQKNCCIQ